MPSKSVGNIITKINFTKKGVSLFFASRRLSITNDAFSSTYLYVGKALTNKQIKELENLSNITKLMEYAFSLLRKSHYTEWKMREKLYKKEGNKEQVDLIIKKLKTHDLINDEMYALDYVEYCHENHIGKNKIILGLKNRGVFEKEINKIRFSSKLEKQKALYHLPKLENRYNQYPFRKKKDKIYQQLLSLGFDHDIAIDVINKISDKDKKLDKNKIKKDYDLISTRLKRKYEGKVLKDKIVRSLFNKGYSFHDINQIMEVDDYDY